MVAEVNGHSESSEDSIRESLIVERECWCGGGIAMF